MKSVFRSVVSLLCIVCLICPAPAKADVVGDLTLGVTLGNLMDQVQQAIEKAQNAGLSIEIQAGREVAIAIQNAQNAYANSLNLTMSAVGSEISNTVAQLNTLVTGVESNAFSNLDDLAAKVQQIVNTLPFRNKEPQLTKVTPNFVVPANITYPVMLRLGGNFTNSGEPGYSPKLKVGANSYDTASATNQLLTFSVPITDLFSNPSSSTFNSTSVTAIVPWQSCRLKIIWCWLHKNESDSYKIFLGALPASPGKITLNWTTPGSIHNTKVFKSQTYYLTSASDGNNDDHTQTYALNAEAGWHIQQGLSKIDEDEGSSTGSRSSSFISDSGDVASFSVSTQHRKFGVSGQTHFQIEITEYQDVPTINPNSADIPLKWGDSKAFNYTAGTWTITFDAFDGTHSEFTSSDETNPFVKVRASGGPYIIGTADPATLVWP
jgi:hypothetical protein